MIRFVMITAAALFLGAALLKLLQFGDGYVLIVTSGRDIEMRLSFAIFAFIASLAVLLLLIFGGLKILRAISGSWQRTRQFRSRRVDARTQRGLMRYVEGDWRSAKKDLIKAAKNTDKPLVHYLAAARSAYELGESETARALIAQAQKVVPNSELAIALAQARFQYHDRKFEQCLATLNRIKSQAPDNPVILDLLKKVFWALKDWRALEMLLPELSKNKVLLGDAYASLEHQVYLNQLIDLYQQLHNLDAEEISLKNEAAHIGDLWQSIPKEKHRVPDFVEYYARLLLLVQDEAQAELVLREALKTSWSPALVDLYGLVKGPDPKSQLQHAQQWEKLHADDAYLQLTLGRLNIRNEIWGQAKEHLLKSLNLKASVHAYAELAKILARLGDHEQSAQCYQKGLELSLNPFAVGPSNLSINRA